jgi:2-oxoisovalerate dehydrogenase E1 component
MYEKMTRIRVYEEKVTELYVMGRLPGFLHSYAGEEAVAVGICANLSRGDYVSSTHRADGHCIAMGTSVSSLMAEAMGRRSGCCNGKGGTMHVVDIENGVLGASGIVGSGIPIAVGAGLSARLKRTDRVSVAFFGDGAVATGAFHEAVNLAAAWNLPVLFVCENNRYSTWTPFSVVSGTKNVADRAAGYGITGVVADGMDVISVYKVGREAVLRARSEKGPTLIECETYRFSGHHAGDPDTYRPKSEKDEWIKKDPIKKLGEALIAKGFASEEELNRIEGTARREIEESVAFSEAQPYPEKEEALRDVFFEGKPGSEREISVGPSKDSRELSFRDALTEAIREEMVRDERVFTYGQGFMGKRGGAFGVTKGLQDIFGLERVRDSPISELAMVGCAHGAALTGMRPVVEIMYNDWITLAMDQIVNQVAMARYVSAGRVKVPVVIRTVTGGSSSGGPHHSQCFESWFMHTPGIKVILPSTPYDAKGLLKAAIRDENPCLFMEAQALYFTKGSVPVKEYVVPLGKADVKKEGADITIITWSRMVRPSLSVADRLGKEGVGVEVVDVRTLVPLDKKTIVDSVKKTRHVLIVHEACKTGGAGAEISAIVTEEAFDYLDAPVRRVAAPDVPIPFSPPLERYVVPDETRIEGELREVLGLAR